MKVTSGSRISPELSERSIELADLNQARVAADSEGNSASNHYQANNDNDTGDTESRKRTALTPEQAAHIGRNTGAVLGAATGGAAGSMLGPMGSITMAYVGGNLGGLVGAGIGFASGQQPSLHSALSKDTLSVQEQINDAKTPWSTDAINRQLNGPQTFDQIWSHSQEDRDVKAWLTPNQARGQRPLSDGVQSFANWALENKPHALPPQSEWLGNSDWVKSTLNQYGNDLLSGNQSGAGPNPDLWRHAPTEALLNLNDTRSGTKGVMQALEARSALDNQHGSPGENSVESYFSTPGKTAEFLNRFSNEQLNGDKKDKNIEIPSSIASVMSVGEMLNLAGNRSESEFVKKTVQAAVVTNQHAALELADQLQKAKDSDRRNGEGSQATDALIDNFAPDQATKLALGKAMRAMEAQNPGMQWISDPLANNDKLAEVYTTIPDAHAVDTSESLHSRVNDETAPKPEKTVVTHSADSKFSAGVEAKFNLGVLQTGFLFRAGPALKLPDATDPKISWLENLKLVPAAVDFSKIPGATSDAPKIEFIVDTGAKVNLTTQDGLPSANVSEAYVRPKVELKISADAADNSLFSQVGRTMVGPIAAGFAEGYADYKTNQDFMHSMGEASNAAARNFVGHAAGMTATRLASAAGQAMGYEAKTETVNVLGWTPFGNISRVNPPSGEAQNAKIDGFDINTKQQSKITLAKTGGFEVNALVEHAGGANIQQRKRVELEEKNKHDSQIENVPQPPQFRDSLSLADATSVEMTDLGQAGVLNEANVPPAHDNQTRVPETGAKDTLTNRSSEALSEIEQRQVVDSLNQIQNALELHMAQPADAGYDTALVEQFINEGIELANLDTPQDKPNISLASAERIRHAVWDQLQGAGMVPGRLGVTENKPSTQTTARQDNPSSQTGGKSDIHDSYGDPLAVDDWEASPRPPLMNPLHRDPSDRQPEISQTLQNAEDLEAVLDELSPPVRPTRAGPPKEIEMTDLSHLSQTQPHNTATDLNLGSSFPTNSSDLSDLGTPYQYQNSVADSSDLNDLGSPYDHGPAENLFTTADTSDLSDSSALFGESLASEPWSLEPLVDGDQALDRLGDMQAPQNRSLPGEQASVFSRVADALAQGAEQLRAQAQAAPMAGDDPGLRSVDEILNNGSSQNTGGIDRSVNDPAPSTTPTPSPSPISNAGDSGDSSARSLGGGVKKSAESETRIGAGDGNLTGKYGADDPQLAGEAQWSHGDYSATAEGAIGADATYRNEVDADGHRQMEASANVGGGAKVSAGYQDEDGNFARGEAAVNASAGASASSTRNAETGIRDTSAGVAANASANATASWGTENGSTSATLGAEAEAGAEGGVRTNDDGDVIGVHGKVGAEVGVDGEVSNTVTNDKGSSETGISAGVGFGASADGEFGMNQEGNFVIGGEVEGAFIGKLGLSAKMEFDIDEYEKQAEDIDNRWHNGDKWGAVTETGDMLLDSAEKIPLAGGFITGGRDAVGGFVDSADNFAKGDFKGGFEDIGEGLLDGAEDIPGIGGAVKKLREDGFMKTAMDASEAVTDGLEKVGDKISDGAEKVGEGIKDGAEAVGEGIKDGAEAVGEGIKDGAEAVGEGIKDGAEAVGEGIKDGAEAVGDGIKDGFKAIGGLFS